MDDGWHGKSKAVTAQLTPAEYTEVVKAAKREEVTLAELARVLILFAMDRLAAGDADLLRAVKGSRDASVR